MSHIANAVEPLRSAAVERARVEARLVVDLKLAQLSADPSIAKRPSALDFSQADYARKMHTCQLVCSLTSEVFPENWADLNILEKMSARPNLLRVGDETKIAAFITAAAEQAESAYTVFIAKLEKKIGVHDSAVLTGDHVWGYSVLTVGKGTETESWRTQQIVNVSKLGKMFNQWPTRKVR